MHRPAFDGDDDGERDRGEHGRREAEERDLAEEIRRRPEADGLLTPEDLTLFTISRIVSAVPMMTAARLSAARISTASWGLRLFAPGWLRPDPPGMSSVRPAKANGRASRKRR